MPGPDLTMLLRQLAEERAKRTWLEREIRYLTNRMDEVSPIKPWRAMFEQRWSMVKAGRTPPDFGDPDASR